MFAMNDVIGLPWESTYQNLDIDDNWLPIVEKLHRDLLEIDPGYVVAQVKEKFGGLRYYAYPSRNAFDGVKEKFYDRIRQAEIEVDKLSQV